MRIGTFSPPIKIGSYFTPHQHTSVIHLFDVCSLFKPHCTLQQINQVVCRKEHKFITMGKQFLDKTTVTSMPCKEKESSLSSALPHAHLFVPSTSPRVGRSKAVSFGSLKIRSHSVILGDHPCCSAGCPLELGWDYQSETEVSVDEYETSRAPRRNSKEMLTTWRERRELLSEYTDGDVRRATRKLQRSKRSSRDLTSFFGDV